jgi:2-oxoglutarate ferredoxin oxidoreductase subunit delta
MAKVTIYEDTCKGCGLCVSACPKKILEINTSRLNAKGYHPAGITDQDACIACASCARICPDVAIEIEK